MRKITAQAAARFMQGTSWANGNTAVSVTLADGEPITTMYLHNNTIAIAKDGMLYLTLAGWGTPTTRERLNGLLQTLGYNPALQFSQHRGGQYFEGTEIEAGQWIKLPQVWE